MHNAPQSHSEISRPIATAPEAQAAIVQLTAVMDSLKAVVVEETALVRAGQLRKATDLGVKKTELSGRYFKAVERLKVSSKLLSRIVPQDVSALARRHELLQAVLKSN